MKRKAWWNVTARQWAYRFLITAAFCAPFSLLAGRLFLALSLLALLWARVRHAAPIRCSRIGWLWLSFVAVSFLVSLQGIDPVSSVGDITKLLWFAGIPIAATLIDHRQRAIAFLTAYVYGSVIRSLDILLLRVPRAALQDERTFMEEVIHRGSMTHGQVLMLAMIGGFGLLLLEIHRRGGWRYLTMQISRFGLLTLAMVMNFKRGSWAAVTLVLALFGMLTGKVRFLLILVIIMILSSFHPYVRSRVAHLQNELQLDHGGRLVMWTQLAPELLRQYPLGVGFRGVTPEVMQETAHAVGVRVEEGRNHLHSNFVDIPVTVGWGAFALYLAWMGTALYFGFTSAHTQPDFTGKLLALTYSLMLVSLILNGVVEFNMGDAYIVLPYGMIMGVLANARQAFTPQDSTI